MRLRHDSFESLPIRNNISEYFNNEIRFLSFTLSSTQNHFELIPDKSNEKKLDHD